MQRNPKHLRKDAIQNYLMLKNLSLVICYIKLILLMYQQR